jgi:hypothetical protein
MNTGVNFPDEVHESPIGLEARFDFAWEDILEPRFYLPFDFGFFTNLIWDRKV